jgi:hypothetical protein
MMIKKHPNRNTYLRTPDNLWVRDFTVDSSPFIDLNKLILKQEYSKIIENEITNYRKKYVEIGSENREIKKIVIVSDGYKFSEKHKILSSLSSDIGILAVNKSLSKWELDGKITYYILNNPYEECLTYLPKKKYYPRCIASTRTNPNFLSKYKGNIYAYIPVSNQDYTGPRFPCEYKIDDYRNSICASIGLAYRFGVEKLFLLCCDDSVDQERPGTVKLENNLFCYPQQIVSNNLIDANLFWLKNKEIKIGYNGNGPKLDNATYIELDYIKDFFNSD